MERLGSGTWVCMLLLPDDEHIVAWLASSKGRSERGGGCGGVDVVNNVVITTRSAFVCAAAHDDG